MNHAPLLMGDDGYRIERSLRFRASASGHLRRTFSASGTTATFSFWVKRGALGSSQSLFGYSDQAANDFNLVFSANDQITLSSVVSGTTYVLTSAAVYRDPSAWLHIVAVIDTTHFTASERLRMFVNGVRLTSFAEANYPPQSAILSLSNSWNYGIGARGLLSGVQTPFDGLMAEVRLVNAQALAPTVFGGFDHVTGVWVPKRYTGTYGTSGFYLDFKDNSAATAAAIGADRSGNGNNWTPVNISLSAGVTYDSFIDVPTAYADGGNGRGNYCTLNPTAIRSGVTPATFSEANLRITATSGTNAFGFGTSLITNGQWYFEATVAAVGSSQPSIGVAPYESQSTGFTHAVTYQSDGNRVVNGTISAYGASYTNNDVVGVALNMGTGTVVFYKNNVSQGSISLPSPALGAAPLAAVLSSASFILNFGQRPFAYAPPAGFKALHTGNLPEPVIKKPWEHFEALAWVSNGGTQNVTGAAFTPDLVWAKSRSTVGDHVLNDIARGAANVLRANTTGAESSNPTYLTAFNSDGFSLGSGNFFGSGGAIASWLWKAGGPVITNNAGSITSQVSANPLAGFSIVTYTGSGANATVGHGLGSVPKLIIIKNRSSGSVNWPVYSEPTLATRTLFINTTDAQITDSNYWRGIAPTSLVFSIGTAPHNNGNGNGIVAYCFAEVPGYSRMGSYTGNGSADGPFVWCGLRPRYVLIKRADAVGAWTLLDAARSDVNLVTRKLQPQSSATEIDPTSDSVDFVANGFKCRGTGTDSNANGGTYIFMAFAEAPFKYALAR